MEREAGGPALLALGLSVADSIYYSHRVYPVLCLVVGCIVAAWFAARAKSGGESYLYTFSAGILLAATFIGFASSGYWPVPITVVPFGCFWVYFVVRMAKAFRKNGGIQFSMRTLLRFLVFASLVFATTSASAFLPRSI